VNLNNLWTKRMNTSRGEKRSNFVGLEGMIDQRRLQ
jgi:hypothetical protein